MIAVSKARNKVYKSLWWTVLVYPNGRRGGGLVLEYFGCQPVTYIVTLPENIAGCLIEVAIYLEMFTS